MRIGSGWVVVFAIGRYRVDQTGFFYKGIDETTVHPFSLFACVVQLDMSLGLCNRTHDTDASFDPTEKDS